MRSHNNTNRTVAILLGTIAGSIVAGRLLPPLIAALASAGRVRAGRDPFAQLIDDHRKIRGLLDEMLAATTDSRLNRGRLFLALKRKLAKHAMAEEDVVYPIVSKHSATEGKHLYDEHADMKVFLYDIESRLMAGEDWNEPVRSLRALVLSHVNEEENTVFPRLRQQLDESALPKVSGQISREEALVV
jgi:hemerythrin superfamily protein